jgi:glycosyltransferase involved in cell wall biosynthesis
MQQAARVADLVVAVSRETEAAFAERFVLHERDKRTVVAPLGISTARNDTAFALPCKPPYFVMVGTIEPRKNHQFILMIWRRLRERLGALTPHLVIIGARGWENENVIDLLERSSQLRPLVHECNRTSDAETVHILRNAQALLLPSLAEGFGLPLAEALALGVPAICSDIAVFREVAGSVPEFVDPLDGLAWLEAIADYSAEGSPRRAAQLARQSSWRAPTWDEHFAKILPRLFDGDPADTAPDRPPLEGPVAAR